MQARDVMVADVITVREETSVPEVARLMTERRVSGLPVVNADGAVIGLVSDGDLIHRAELETEVRHNWWLRHFSDPDRIAREYAKSHGLKAGDVMSRTVIAVQAGDELGHVAEVLDRNRIKRVPVLDGRRLVGIIARSDIVRCLARQRVPAEEGKVDDGALYRQINEEIDRQSWLTSRYFNVIVSDGMVELRGFAASDDQRRALRVLVAGVAGVRRVEDRLQIGMPSFVA